MGDLRELQAEYSVVTEEKLSVGALIQLSLTEDDGLVLKNGRPSRSKKIIIIGEDKVAKVYYGAVLINSKMNFRSQYSSEFLSAQYRLTPEDYPNFLSHDSFADCAQLFSISQDKLLGGKYFGVLSDQDLTGVFDILETTETLSTKEKKRFGIKRR